MRDLGRLSRRGATTSAFCLLTCLVLALAAAAPALAQPTFVGALSDRTSSQSGNTSITLPIPAGVAGDLLIAVVGVKINPSTADPAGWTPIIAGFNNATCASQTGDGIRCQNNAWYRISDGTETSVTVSWATIRQAAGAVLRYSNVDTTTPIGASAEQAGTGTSPTAPSITTGVANARVLRVVVADADLAKSELLTPPATERYNQVSTSPFGPGSSFTIDAVVVAGSDSVVAAAGASGTASWSLPADEQWNGMSIEIRPFGAVTNADLAITKDDGETIVNQGQAITYTIEATNNGPDDVTGAAVEDTFPSSLTCSWTCSAGAGASCTAGPVAGDISDTVDLEAGATATYTASCTVAGDASGTITNTATITEPDGVVDDDSSNNSASDTDTVNQPPVAQCTDVTVDADAMCQADASIDDGSFDPDGDPVTIDETPAGPYPLSDTLVTLTIEDDKGASDTCQATVTVEDNAAPVIQCNSPPTIVPPDAPISFTATATDNCSVASVEVVETDCFKFTKKGKRIDKTESCVVSASGATVTISDSGGVGTTITWLVTATDGSGNSISMSCSVDVANPGQS